MPTTAQLGIGAVVIIALVVAGITLLPKGTTGGSTTPSPGSTGGSTGGSATGGSTGPATGGSIPGGSQPSSKIATNPEKTALIQRYTAQLNDMAAAIPRQPSVSHSFSKIGRFYVSPNAASPDVTQLTLIDTKSMYTTINEYVTHAPPDATVFIYDPATHTCKYYSGTVSLSNVERGSLIVGTTLL